MERDVSGVRQRVFFQSICPASRPRVNGTGPIKRLDIAETSPKILMKGCSVEWPRTLNSSDRHPENSRVLNLSSSTASDSLVLQENLNRFIVTSATLCQNHFQYLIIAEKGEGLLTFLQQQQFLALEANVCDSKQSPSLSLASIKQGNQKSSAAQRRNSTVS